MPKHIYLEPEIIFHCTNDEMNSEFVKEYSQMFESLDLSSIPRYNDGAGSSGYDQHAMIKALIVYSKEGYRSVLQLVRELEAKPYFSRYVLGFKDTVPDSSTFYRFINSFDQEKIISLCAQVNKTKLRSDLSKIKNIAIDAKPIVANTKENNPKCFVHNLSDKTIPPKRSEESALGYLTSTNDINGKAKVIFFWGYKIHLIVDADTDTPLVWKIEPANRRESSVALELYELLIEHYLEFLDNTVYQTADKAYDARHIYETFFTRLNGYSAISRNTRKTITDKKLAADGSPICRAGHKMRSNGSWYDADSYRYKFRCPKLRFECLYRKSDYGCTKFLQESDPIPGKIEPFRQKYAELYSKRQSVERVNAYLTSIGFDFPNHFSKKSIQNLIGFALLAKALSKKRIAKLRLAA